MYSKLSWGASRAAECTDAQSPSLSQYENHTNTQFVSGSIRAMLRWHCTT